MKEPLQRLFGFQDRAEDTRSLEIRSVRVDAIVASPYQPRTIFDDDRIEELSQTIKTHGVIQPIVVRKRNDGYELIAGERRLRAARHLGMDTIPAIIREMNDTQAASVSLIENLQREGLTSIEEAIAYHQLLELHGLTQESLAQRLGKGQSTIANKLRLLHLPEEVQEALRARKISERHARALLSLPTSELQLQVMAEIIKNDWNVKQTENRVSSILDKATKKPQTRKISFSKDIRLAVNTIRQSLDMIQKNGLSVLTEEEDLEEYYQFTIRVPKKK